MVRLGFSPAVALRTIMTVGDYTHGFVLQEQARIGPPSPEEVAMLSEAFRSGGYRVPGEAFEHGLNVLIAGTEVMLGN